MSQHLRGPRTTPSAVFTLATLATFGLLASACMSSNDAAGKPLPPPISDSGVVASMVVTVSIPQGAGNKGNSAYGQNPLTIDPNTTVSWTNHDTVAHTATSDSLIWDSGPLDPGEAFSFTFTTPGTYPYHCTIYGKNSMSGVIEVRTTVAAPSMAQPASR